ncbi:MAG: hypothetical protein F9K30_00310 [Dechloromonas sp.]|nr:MAG: hypothetical protein F9K30_00310 [Dechloromonas sp.]
MSTSADIPTDQFAALADTETQRLAARMAQDAFAGAFRLAVAADEAADQGALGEAAARCFNWCQAAGSDEARALRLALLVSGMDQWGLAYTQAFRLQAIPDLTVLIGGLRTRLDAGADARFQQYFAAINEDEAAVIDFKIALRRAIHLALWHAMAACETSEQVGGIVQALGSMMLGLNGKMPTLGWRLLADALASMQISLLTGGVPPMAAEGTQQLFAALQHALPGERYQAIMAYSTQAVLGWQQAQRARPGDAGEAS